MAERKWHRIEVWTDDVDATAKRLLDLTAKENLAHYAVYDAEGELLTADEIRAHYLDTTGIIPP